MPAVRFIFIILALLPNLVYGFSSKKPELPPLPDFQRLVPVQLFSGDNVEIKIKPRGVLECFRNGDFSEIYYISSAITFKTKNSGLAIYDNNGMITDSLSSVLCKPRDGASFVGLMGITYRGFFKVVYDNSSDDLALFNIVDLEDYLKGVLPAEIGERSGNEYGAAKAQAVAARTYAVWKLVSDGEKARLFPTVADQVYNGRDSEIEILNKAVKDTEGEILMYKGGPIAAYYHAVCGGRTIPIRKAWPDKGRLPYLGGTNDKNYCEWAKTYSWSETFNMKTLSSHFEKYFTGRNLAREGDFDSIINIEFIFDKKTKRALEMKIFTESNIYSVESDQIRWALGRQSNPEAILPSTKFTLRKIKTGSSIQGLEITGRGNGHGVGACQCGFIGRARAGQSYEKMLKAYYKNVKLVKIY